MILDLLSDNTLIICNHKIKKNILKECSLKKILCKISFISLQEFENKYYGTYKKDALVYLVRKYNLNVDVAKEYLKNLFNGYVKLDKYYQELKNNDLLEDDLLFRKSLKDKKIIVIENSVIDKRLINVLNKYNAFFYKSESNNYKPVVIEANTLEDEIVYAIEDILKKDSVNLNDVYFVNVGSEYYLELKRICDFFNVPIRINQDKKIYSSKVVQDFLHELEISKSLDKSLKLIDDKDIYKKVIDIINLYDCSLIDDALIKVIRYELKNATIINEDYEEAITLIDFEDVDDPSKYYYILNFNQGIVPRIFHDDKFIKDNERIKLGLKTSLDRLENNKENIKRIINNYPNVYISYKLKDFYREYSVSPLVNELNLDICKDRSITYLHSNLYNKFILACQLDDYFKFNRVSDSLKQLYNSYNDINYDSYNNEFSNIPFSKLKEYLNGELILSYSSLNTFFHCSFRYYIKKILNLDPFKDNFSTFIGNLFHNCLSHMYDADFDLRKCYDNYLEDKKLNNKEQFFVDKLYADLEFIVGIIKIQDRHSKFDKALLEQEISIEVSSLLKYKFIGYVDKIKYYAEDEKKYLAIVDYKTGSINASLDNIKYGFNLQLPIYMYLIKKGMDSNYLIAGIYLQKLLHSLKTDKEDIDEEMKKDLRLLGYSIDREDVLKLFDDTYEDSIVIQGMKKSKNGFYQYTKLFNEIDVDKIVNIVQERINEIINCIEKGDFSINPKRFANDLKGCEFCQFRDLCFKKEEDIKDLTYEKFNDSLGSDCNGLD